MNITGIKFFEPIANANWKTDRITATGAVETPSCLGRLYSSYNASSALRGAKLMMLENLENLDRHTTVAQWATVKKAVENFNKVNGENIEEKIRKRAINRAQEYVLNNEGCADDAIATLEKCNFVMEILQLPNVDIGSPEKLIDNLINQFCERVDSCITAVEEEVLRHQAVIPKEKLSTFVEQTTDSKVNSNCVIKTVIANEVMRRVCKALTIPFSEVSISHPTWNPSNRRHLTPTGAPISSEQKISRDFEIKWLVFDANFELNRLKILSHALNKFHVTKTHTELLKTKLIEVFAEKEVHTRLFGSLYNEALKELNAEYTSTSISFEPIDVEEITTPPPAAAPVPAPKRRRRI